MSPLKKGFEFEGFIPLIGFSHMVCAFSEEVPNNTKQKKLNRKA
jgi:hypothetical protein